MEQRSDAERPAERAAESRPLTRRHLLTRAAGAAVAGFAGCTAEETGVNRTTTTARSGAGSGRGRSATIAILGAGSLQNALERGLRPAVDVPVTVEAHGSATVARMIDEGHRDPDIVTVADTALFEEPLSPPWYSVFTSNAIVIAYNPETAGGQRLADAGENRWYEPMIDGDVSIGRTDPDLDPLGYRTLFTLDLASQYYDEASELRAQIPRDDQIYPETSLISQFETGSIDAAFAYRNMAIERGYEYLSLPDQIDLSTPRYAEDWYQTVSHTQSNGQEIQGGLIRYASAIRKMSEAALAVFDTLTTGRYLDGAGFVRDDQFPIYEGDPPTRVTAATSQSTANQSLKSPPRQSLDGSISDVTILV